MVDTGEDIKTTLVSTGPSTRPGLSARTTPLRTNTSAPLPSCFACNGSSRCHSVQADLERRHLRWQWWRYHPMRSLASRGIRCYPPSALEQACMSSSHHLHDHQDRRRQAHPHLCPAISSIYVCWLIKNNARQDQGRRPCPTARKHDGRYSSRKSTTPKPCKPRGLPCTRSVSHGRM